MAEEMITTVVTKRDETMPASVNVQTPSGTADIRVVAMTAVAQTLVRGLRSYVLALLGLLGAGQTGLDRGALPNEFGALLWTCAGMALAPAVMSLLGNAAEFLLKIDESFPQMRA